MHPPSALNPDRNGQNPAVMTEVRQLEAGGTETTLEKERNAREIA